MIPIRYELWENVPGQGPYTPYMLYYEPKERRSDGVILLIPGSGYRMAPLAKQEGERVSEYLCERGMTVFMLVYRAFPGGCYPLPLLDGRRAVRWIRHHCEEFGLCSSKIVTVGYSAGGHLNVSLTGYHEPLEGEGVDDIDKEDYRPNLQALCYPVISFDLSKDYTHTGSVEGLLGDELTNLAPILSFEQSLDTPAPPTFLFHNFDDASVGVQNSLLYACRLRELGSPVELHVYPDGGHGVGLAIDDKPSSRHNCDWISRFINWLEYNGFFKEQE